MATPLEIFDALEVRANAVGHGHVVTINETDACVLKQLTVSDLVRRGLTQKSADYICGILLGDSEPFHPLGEFLGIHIQVSDRASSLIEVR